MKSIISAQKSYKNSFKKLNIIYSIYINIYEYSCIYIKTEDHNRICSINQTVEQVSNSWEYAALLGFLVVKLHEALQLDARSHDCWTIADLARVEMLQVICGRVIHERYEKIHRSLGRSFTWIS